MLLIVVNHFWGRINCLNLIELNPNSPHFISHSILSPNFSSLLCPFLPFQPSQLSIPTLLNFHPLNSNTLYSRFPISQLWTTIFFLFQSSLLSISTPLLSIPNFSTPNSKFSSPNSNLLYSQFQTPPTPVHQ